MTVPPPFAPRSSEPSGCAAGSPAAPQTGPDTGGGRGGAAFLEGQVRGTQVRSEYRGQNQPEVILSFRVERYDAVGNRILLVPVELRGLSIEGSLADGDRVRAGGRMKSGILRVTRVENLTTGTSVVAKGIPKPLLVLAWVLIAAIAAFVVWGLSTVLFGSPGPPAGFPGG
ncbi:hypothetical protein [Streptomyces sp. L2]|uniref:hypothetical protein n=1 Tax=Streptomyces sp. L2 TaxID=2162665 RepID=UPI001012295F|nr:hypothetical protein [Streptomyces sp. L2]